MFTGSIVAIVTPMDEKGNVCRALTAERRTTACWNVSITAERTASQS